MRSLRVTHGLLQLLRQAPLPPNIAEWCQAGVAGVSAAASTCSCPKDNRGLPKCPNTSTLNLTTALDGLAACLTTITRIHVEGFTEYREESKRREYRAIMVGTIPAQISAFVELRHLYALPSRFLLPPEMPLQQPNAMFQECGGSGRYLEGAWLSPYHGPLHSGA